MRCIPALLLLAALLPGARAGEAYTAIDLPGLDPARAIAGTTAAGTPAAYANRGAVRVFDGSGMSGDGLVHGTAADGAMFMLSSNNSGSFPFYIQVDLGGMRRIDRVRLFNFNFVKNGVSYAERGVRNFQLYVSDGAAWSTSVASIRANYSPVLSNALSRATGTADYAGETFDLPETVSARFVALVALDDWDDSRDALNYNGLSEIQFFAKDDGDSGGGGAAHDWSESGILLEAEAFGNRGGWVVDPQFVDVMGSPYLLAHGLGVPVADATTRVRFGETGPVRAWVRTRDWTPDYDGEKPGRFALAVDGVEFPNELGVAPPDWGWVDAGVLNVEAGIRTVSLVDRTGFEGRCDAVWLTSDTTAPAPPGEPFALAAWRAAKRGESGPPEDIVTADLVVVGGGIAGTCAAIAAADAGLSVALVQDRPMLGGNASDEVRVQTQKSGHEFHWIVKAVKNTSANAQDKTSDDAARMSLVASYPSIATHLGWRAYGVETNAERRIVAVDARNVETGARRRFVAPLFCDATGDGWLGFWAGAAYRMGREAKAEFDEPNNAPATADSSTMGSSLMWTTRTGATEYAFPSVPWATTVSGSRADTSGDWTWEAGLGTDEDTIYDAEALRDRLFRAIFGSFSNAKRKAGNEKLVFKWVPYIAGKRESRRIVGDYIVREGDVENARPFEDAIGIATWTIDLHFYNGSSGFITATKHVTVPNWWMPYRSLCCRDVPNLFLAGRCASYTHVALGSSRVMHAGGQQGVAAGYAAALCTQYGCDPREIYRDAAKTAALQALINKRGDYAWPDPTPERVVVSRVVDNDDASGVEISGAWSTSSHSANRYGDTYLHSGKGASDDLWVRFTPDLPSNATYRVSLAWNGDSSRGGAVPVEIVHDGGVATNLVDQTSSLSLWNRLGEWPFAAGTAGSVRLLTAGQDGRYVIADAVRFEIVERDEGDDTDANGIPADWERRHFLQISGTDPDGDPDADGLSNLGEWLADTDPHDAASRFSMRGIAPVATARTITLSWPSVEGRTYTVLRAEHLGEPFVPYRTGIPATPPENVIDLPSDDSDAAFYRIAIDTP